MNQSARPQSKYWVLGLIVIVVASAVVALFISNTYVSEAEAKVSVAAENLAESQQALEIKIGLVNVANDRAAEYASYAAGDYVLPQEEQARKVMRDAQDNLEIAQEDAISALTVLTVSEGELTQAEKNRTLVYRVSLGAVVVTAIFLGAMAMVARRNRVVGSAPSR